MFLSNLWVTIYFLLGAAFRSLVTPNCNRGVQKLDISSDEVECSCLAGLDNGMYGAVSCRSTGIVCLLNEANTNGDKFCGEAKFSESFKRDGSFASMNSPLYAYLFVFGEQPDSDSIPFEINIRANKADSTRLSNCEAFIDMEKCSSCNICEDGLSFTFNCESDDPTKPNLSNVGGLCYNVAFQKV